MNSINSNIHFCNTTPLTNVDSLRSEAHEKLKQSVEYENQVQVTRKIGRAIFTGLVVAGLVDSYRNDTSFLKICGDALLNSRLVQGWLVLDCLAYLQTAILKEEAKNLKAEAQNLLNILDNKPIVETKPVVIEIKP